MQKFLSFQVYFQAISKQIDGKLETKSIAVDEECERVHKRFQNFAQSRILALRVKFFYFYDKIKILFFFNFFRLPSKKNSILIDERDRPKNRKVPLERRTITT